MTKRKIVLIPTVVGMKLGTKSLQEAQETETVFVCLFLFLSEISGVEIHYYQEGTCDSTDSA